MVKKGTCELEHRAQEQRDTPGAGRNVEHREQQGGQWAGRGMGRDGGREPAGGPGQQELCLMQVHLAIGKPSPRLLACSVTIPGGICYAAQDISTYLS